MKIASATLTTWLLLTAAAEAECIVADPAPPLNARAAPNGPIIGELPNGKRVTILNHALDERNRPWVYVSDPENNQAIGWVYRSYLACKANGVATELILLRRKYAAP